MKSDRYLKIVLTVIAICLVWICIRDIKIGPKKLYANGGNSGEQEVYITGTSGRAFRNAGPIEVEIVNWQESLAVPQPEDK